MWRKIMNVMNRFLNTMRRPDRLPAVAVEYDARRGRERKEFADAFAARRFYAAKQKAGKNPKVCKLENSEKKNGESG